MAVEVLGDCPGASRLWEELEFPTPTGEESSEFQGRLPA